MSLREDRKKVQRSVLYWVENCPADKVLPELLKLKQTVDSQISLLTPRPECLVCGEPTLDGLSVCYDHAVNDNNGQPTNPESSHASNSPSSDNDDEAAPPTAKEAASVTKEVSLSNLLVEVEVS